MKSIYQNKEFGNIWERRIDAVNEAFELYDYADPTNIIPLTEYYDILCELTPEDELFSTGGGCYCLVARAGNTWCRFSNEYKPIVSVQLFPTKDDALNLENEGVYLSDDESYNLMSSITDDSIKKLFL